jgi:hypothetical protein
MAEAVDDPAEGWPVTASLAGDLVAFRGIACRTQPLDVCYCRGVVKLIREDVIVVKKFSFDVAITTPVPITRVDCVLDMLGE